MLTYMGWTKTSDSLNNNIKIISSDSHVVEPPGLWEQRMDLKKWGDRIPRTVTMGSYDQWLVDNQPIGTIGGASTAGMRFTNPEEIRLEGSFDDVLLGGYDPDAHVKDLDLDGIYADYLYSSVATNMYAIEDPNLLRAIFSAYNDWLAEFCNTNPLRLKGIAHILLDDGRKAGLDELERAAKMGLPGAMIPIFPRSDLYYEEPFYDPLWERAQELDMPLSLHIGTRRPGSRKMDDQGQTTQGPADRSTSDYWVRLSLAHIIFSGVFERYPKLKIINVEQDLGWIPYFMDRMDTTYRDRPFQISHSFKNGSVPSDFMKTNVYHSFQEDSLGIQLRDYIGVDKLVWGSDYPHTESTFPESQRIISEILDGVPEEEKVMILGSNCANLYGINYAEA